MRLPNRTMRLDYRQATGIQLANPHRFRRTFASDMIRAGMSLPALIVGTLRGLLDSLAKNLRSMETEAERHTASKFCNK